MAIKDWFVDEWNRAHKMASVQVASIAGTLIALSPAIVEGWRSMPDDLKALLPLGVSRWTAVAAFALVILARLKKQKSVAPADTDEKPKDAQ